MSNHGQLPLVPQESDLERCERIIGKGLGVSPLTPPKKLEGFMVPFDVDIAIRALLYHFSYDKLLKLTNNLTRIIEILRPEASASLQEDCQSSSPQRETRTHLTEEERAEILRLYTEGWNYNRIAIKVGRHGATVANAIKRAARQGSDPK